MKYLFSFFLSIVATLNLLAQRDVTGIVVDEIGQPLPGATVIAGTSNASTTDFNGKFVLRDASSDEFTIRVSYLGYEPKEVPVPSQTFDLGIIQLSFSSEQLEEVVLNATFLPSQIRALNIQKKSVNVKNVLAADAIGKLPDRNAAEAVQRIQGVSIERDHGEGRYVIVRGTPIKWNSNLINGNRLPASEGTSNNTGGDRAVPLDIFPSEMIQYVELSKAITPDMEGDAIGGSVNFITRTAPSKTIFNINLANGYNAQAQAGTQNYSALFGTKLGKFGFVGSATLWDRNWATDNYELAYNSNLSGQQQYSIAEFELRDYIGQRKTVGFNLAAEYEFDNNNKLYLRGLQSTFEDNESAREHLFELPSPDAEGNPTTEGTMSVRTRNGITQIQLQGFEFGGNHAIGRNLAIDWKYSNYTNEMTNVFLPKQNDPSQQGYLLAWFDQTVEFSGLAPDGYKYLDIDSPSGYLGQNKNQLTPGVSAGSYNPDAAVLGLLYNYQQTSYEHDDVAQLDLTYKSNDKITFKGGMKYRAKEKRGGSPLTISIPAAFYRVPGARLAVLSEFERESFPANGGFLSETGVNYDNVIQDHVTIDQLHRIFTPEVKNSIGFIDIVRDETSPDSASSFYDGEEDVLALYAMAEIQTGEKSTMIVGFRNESTEVTYNGNQVNADETITAVTQTNNTNAFLPMLHYKYSPTEDINIKAAITRTFARPDFSDLNPGAVINDIAEVIIKGNPALENTFSTNFDLMGEYYLNNVGIISAGLFYKALENDIFSASSRQNGYTVIQPENAEKGTLLGAEFGISKRLGSSGFGIDANYTFTDSKVNVPIYSVSGETISKEVIEQKIPGQADHVFNASIFYEKNGLLVRLASNYKGDYIEIYSNDGPNHNRWYGENLTVDFSAAYTLSKRIRLFAEINNLTNEPLYYYHGTNKNRPEQVEYYDLRGQFGLRLNIF